MFPARCSRLWLCVAPILIGTSTAVAVPDVSQLTGRWEQIALPDQAIQYACTTGSGGMLWAATPTGPVYHDGQAFVPAVRVDGPPIKNVMGIAGGRGRDAYLLTRGDGAQDGRLYRLSDGVATHVADFYIDSGVWPSVYVAEDGRLFNIGTRFIAVFTGGAWRRAEARLGRQPLILDDGERVYFYYDEWLYEVDADGAIHERQLQLGPEFENQYDHPPMGALWPPGRLLLVTPDRQGLGAFDLTTGASIHVPSLAQFSEGHQFYRLDTAPDGEVWILAMRRQGAKVAFHRIDADGATHPVPATLSYGLNYAQPRPGDLLHFVDGGVWFALPRGGVARLAGDTLTRFDWRIGLYVNAIDLFAAPDGGTFVLSRDSHAPGGAALYRYRPDEAPAAPPAELARWRYEELASPNIVLDSEGHVWAFLAARPGMMSRHVAGDWDDIAVPVERVGSVRLITDDCGHVIVWDSADQAVYDITPEGLEQFADLNAALVAAVQRGARTFVADQTFQGIVVTADQRIWWGFRGHGNTRMYDGHEWATIDVRAGSVESLVPSAAHGVLICTSGSRYYTYDRGQLTLVADAQQREGRWMIGPHGLQPYEPAMVAVAPALYTVFGGHEARPALEYHKVGEYPPYTFDPGAPRELVSNLYLGMIGRANSIARHGAGLWMNASATNATRVLAGRFFIIDLQDSPLVGRNVTGVYEDGDANIWYELRGDGVFVQSLAGFTLEFAPPPAEVVRRLTLDIKTPLAGVAAEELRVFWRLNGGAWQGGDRGGHVDVRFPETGDYTVELLALEPRGGSSAISELQVHATVPLPETIWTGEPAVTVTDVIWEPDIQLEPGVEGVPVTLAYRVTGGPWVMAAGRHIPVARFCPAGEPITLELATQERDGLRDPSPVTITVTYQPDYEAMIDARLNDLSSQDQHQRERAMQELKLAGPELAPLLKQAAEEARRAYSRAALLENLARQIEYDAQRSGSATPPELIKPAK